MYPRCFLEFARVFARRCLHPGRTPTDGQVFFAVGVFYVLEIKANAMLRDIHDPGELWAWISCGEGRRGAYIAFQKSSGSFRDWDGMVSAGRCSGTTLDGLVAGLKYLLQEECRRVKSPARLPQNE